ncbi:hypothetical protein [Pelagicoccus sp. SDUM812005]|uniref:hypothetical protein n=1 Tax=Pelagicoccus sp. SDUM812005 TaxID=3041257 RepID=UPI00280F867B|nr:hypothetical protein [Pelagicoccus sp. SDUM812005]MDQ8183888.1 hypothetical protein [Pelagicoccus sp. SDUM812005]
MKILLCLILIFPSVLVAQNLWKETVCGMTEQQVLEYFPEAQVPSKPSFIGTGAEEKLEIEKYRFRNRDFSVHFYFDDLGLAQVSLHILERNNHDALALVANELQIELSSILGEPTKKVEENDLLRTLDIEWDRQKTKIGIFVLSTGDSDGILNLNFQKKKTIGPNQAAHTTPASRSATGLRVWL